MSSKNQNESAAALQEEGPENAELGNKVGVDGGVVATEENGMGESGVKVTDKRRTTIQEEIDNSATESHETDAYMIDVDEMDRNEQELGVLRLRVKHLEEKLQESESKLGEATAMVEDYADRFRKAQAQLKAETDEMRARMQRTFDQKLEIGRGDVVLTLLDTLDNLQRAVAAADASGEQAPGFAALRDGVRATAEIFEARLKKLGLAPIDSEGQAFNPEIHEAVEIAAASPEQDNMVLAELQKGYKFGDRLLRPACVRVGRSS